MTRALILLPAASSAMRVAQHMLPRASGDAQVAELVGGQIV